MRQKKVWRYYCDFCRKAGCGKGALAKHEVHCCANPNRVCRMCKLMEKPQAPTAELVAALEDEGEAKLREVSGGCPACILAGILQLRKKLGDTEFYGLDGNAGYSFNFNFKDEMRKELSAIPVGDDGYYNG